MLVNKTKAAKNGAIILLDPQVWYLSGGGIISLNKMIAEVEAAFTDKNNYSAFIRHKTGRTTYASVSRLEQQRRAALFHSGPADEENFAVDGISPSCVCADGLRRAAHFLGTLEARLIGVSAVQARYFESWGCLSFGMIPLIGGAA